MRSMPPAVEHYHTPNSVTFRTEAAAENPTKSNMQQIDAILPPATGSVLEGTLGTSAVLVGKCNAAVRIRTT
jgi:hypothetical protein